MTTLVAKVTYELGPLRCELSRQAEPIYVSDAPEGEGGAGGGGGAGRALTWATDLAPLKSASDVILVGKAFAPSGRPVVEVDARMVVGELEKTVRITGPRRFASDGSALTPQPFTEVALDWTNAAGGEGSWNPVGVRSDRLELGGTSDGPSQLPGGFDLRSRHDYVPPAGFGPIAVEWAPRRDRLHPAASAWLERAAGEAYWPDGADPGFFQAALGDQQLRRPLRADETIVLEHLHRHHARLVTRLPGVALHAMAVDPVRGREAVGFIADTLWIDTDRSLVTVTFRVAVPATSVEGRDVFVWLDGYDAHIVDDIASSADETMQGRGDGGSVPANLPFQGASAGAATRTREEEEFEKLATGTIAAPTAEALGVSMPFVSMGSQSYRPLPAPPAPAPIATPAIPASHRLATPFPTMAPPLAAPPLMAPPLAAPPLQPPGAPAMVPPMAFGPIAAPAAIPIPGWVPQTTSAAPAAVKIDTWKLHEQAAARRSGDDPAVDVARAETPAAAPSAPAAHAAPLSRPSAVEVAWYESVPEVELAGRSKTLRAQLGDEDDDFLSPVEANANTAERSRRDVARWFAKAEAIELDRLAPLLVKTLAEDPGDRSYVVVAGELSWSFDPRESIRAWIALGTPLSADPRIKEAIEAAERTMVEGLAAIPDVLHGAGERLRDAIRSVTKMAGATPIEAAAERYLVEERGFARRRLWAETRIRAHLTMPRARAPVPVYFEVSAGWQSPLVQRFPARVLGEIRSRQDPTEASTICLRGVALGIDLA